MACRSRADGGGSGKGVVTESTVAPAAPPTTPGPPAEPGTDATEGNDDWDPLGFGKEKWGELMEGPPYYRLVAGATLAFVINNMDKVNMSVAIIPMSRELEWSASTAGLVQSSFFWGYCLAQLPGGWIVSKFSGRRVLPVGVLIWSLATAAVPLVAGSLPALCVTRALVGLGEGIGPTSVSELVSKNVPLDQRARATTLIFSGLNVGSIIGLIIAPLLVEAFGWQSVFALFGLLGVGWFAGYSKFVGGGAEQISGRAKAVVASAEAAGEAVVDVDAEVLSGPRPGAGEGMLEANGGEVKGEAGAVEAGAAAVGGKLEASAAEGAPPVPWKEIVATTPFRALTYVHFCQNWGHFTLLSWLPTYFSQLLGLDLTNAALVSLLPPITGIIASSFAAPLADRMVGDGMEVGRVRKISMTVAFMGPAFFLLGGTISDNHVLQVALLSIGVGLQNFSLTGLYCNHGDLSPTYAAVLLGMTNTIGALPGIIGVAFAGVVYDRTQSWELAMFAPSVFFYVTGTAVYWKWGSGDVQEWDPEYGKPRPERVSGPSH